VRESPRKRMRPAQVVPGGVDRGRGPTGSADVETRHVRRGTGRYSVSRDREEETAEGKKSEGPGHAGAFTWWGMGDVRGVSLLWRSCPSHRRAPPLTLLLSRLMSGAGGSGSDSWFRLKAGF
jgi:hypothetical protein